MKKSATEFVYPLSNFSKLSSIFGNFRLLNNLVNLPHIWYDDCMISKIRDFPLPTNSKKKNTNEIKIELYFE